MKRCNALSQLLLSLVALCIAAVTSSAQVQLNAVNTPVTIDFTGYTASGFAPAPAPGQLNSNNWASTGMSDGNLNFGDTQTGGDYARGLWNNSTSGGFYYFDQSGNIRFIVQPTGADFNPGTITLRIQNNTGQALTRLSVGYDVIVNNSGPRANSFNFSYSTNNTAYTTVPGTCGGDYTSPEAADGLGFVVGASKSLNITGLNVAPGSFVYLRWSSADVSGSGNRDQLGLDNIVMTSVQNINTAIAINNYTFSNSSTTISNPTTDLATVAHASLVDDAVSAPISLPFTFYYNGKPYDRVAISSNGWVALGNSANSPVFPATMTSVPLNDPEAWEFNNTPLIAANWDNLRVGASGAVSYGTVGTDFKVRWRSMEWPATATSFITFEMTLSSTCNRIMFSYGGGSNSGLQSATVGLINDADNPAPNNYWVFNGNVAPGNLSNDANANANTRLITYNNLPTGGNPSIFANHYDALRVEGATPLNLGNADASGGVTTANVTVRNLGCSSVSISQANIGYSNSQFTSTAFSATIAPGATASVPVVFTGTCPFDACQITATMAINVAGPLPVVYPADGANLAVQGQETHPVVAAGTLASFPATTLGTTSSVTTTLTNTGNVAYNGTLSVTGINAGDAALFTISPNPVTVPAGGSTVVTVTFTPTGARHAANANATSWVATYPGLQLVLPNGNQTCSPVTIASLAITATSTAPRLSINVPISTEIPGNQGIPTLDIGNRVYGPTPGTPSQPLSYSETFLVKNTGSAQVTINDITRGAPGALNLNDRFVASAVRVTGNAVLLPGNEATYRVTYTPQKTTNDFPYFQPGAYAAVPPASGFVTANALYTFNTALTAASPSSTAPVPAVTGFWHNYQNGVTSTFAPAENLTQLGTMNATADLFRGFMRTVATPATASNQGPTNPAGAPAIVGGVLSVNGAPAVDVNATNGMTVTSYFGVVGDVLPNGGVITNAGQPGTVSFYVVNTGTANARYYVRKQVINDNVNPGAFSLSVPIPGDNANPTLSIIPISSETINGVDYHVFTLEPLYLQTAGNNMAYVRFDVTFKPTRANTPDITTIAQNRVADIQILTDANLPAGAAASVEPRNDLTPYLIRVTGQTLYNDPAFFVDNNQVTGTINFGSHELADATSSNYPFASYFPAGIGYFAPAGELGRRGLATGVNGPKAFGVRDTVITFAIENRGNAPMTFNNMTDLQAFALSGSPGTFNVVKVTDQTAINAAGNAEPAAATFPYTLNANGQRLILWVRYDAGSRSTGAVGQSSGTIRLVQSPLALPTPSTISLSGSLIGRGIRPFPVVNVDGGNAGTITIIDGTERVTPVHTASRPVIFDNYCNLGGVNTNRDTTRISLTIGNGIPAPTQAGGSLPFDNVNDNAVTDVVFNMNNIVIDSLAGNLVIPGASTSYYIDYNVPVVVRNAFGTVVNTQNISAPANRMVTVGANQTMTFSVIFRPTTLNPTPNSIQARVRVAHSSRNNNIDFRADQGPSHTNNSNPTEYGDVYKWMDFIVEGSSLRPAFRLEAGNNAGGMLGNYIAPNATINDFNLPYPYQPGVFVGDSAWAAFTLRNSQETNNVPTGSDVSTGKVGIKAIYIEGADFPDFEIVGFHLPMSTNEPNPVAFPVRDGADNGSPILVNGKSFIQWTADFGGNELGMPFTLDRNMAGMEDASLYVHFKPRRTVNGGNQEVRRAVLRIVTTDLCAPELVYNLEGRALNSELTFDKQTINFGNVQVNDVAQQSVTMTNNGNTPAFFNASTIPAVFPSGPLYSHNFSLYPLGFSLFYARPPYNYSIIGDTETPLNPGDSRTITVQYSPSEGGRKDATMSIGYVPEVPPTLANGNIAQIEIVGRGVAPVTLVTNPISGILEFGNVVVGSSKTLPITITNTGSAPLRLDLPVATIGEFSHNANMTDVVLNAGQSVTIDFTYSPTSFGSDEEIFTIDVPNGFGISTVDIVVRGNGASGAALSASDITFPITRVFTETLENLFLNNTNNLNTTTLTYNGVSGLNADEFELRMNGMPIQIGSSFSVPAGANSSNFNVVFMPTTLPATAGTVNVRNAQLNFTMNGSPISVTVKGEGAIPQISFTAPEIVNGELDFGSISGAAQRTIRVQNIGRFPLNVTQLLLMGQDADRFELGNVRDVVLGNGESIDIRVTLTCDGSSSIDDARLTAISNSLQTRSVELRGACAIPQIGISATSIAFGRTEIGKTIEKTLTIRSASGQPLTVTGLTLDGLNKGEFTIASTSKPLPATVSGNEELVVVIRFAPLAEGSKQARVRIASTVGQTEVSIDAMATVAGTVTLSQQTVNFGSLPVGQSREMSVNVTNHASTPALINSVTIEGDDRAMFTADVTGGFTLQPSESRMVRITFVPSNNGTKFAILRFTTASGVQPVTSLTGKGGSAKINVINVADFGTVSANSFREVQVTVNSTGDETLVINSAYVSGPSSTDFSVMTSVPLEIQPGQSANLTVRFMPTEDGSKVAYLNLLNNSGNAGTVELRGNSITTGVTGEEPATLAFGITQTYPNPFNEMTTVAYTLGARSNVVVKVFNQLGEEVATLFNGVQESGNHTATFKAGTLPTGSYVIRLEAGNQVATQKITLVK